MEVVSGTLFAMEESIRAKLLAAGATSREANSFDCPKCGSLISPENPDSYSEFGYAEQTGALIQCKQCNARVRLLWQTESSLSICKQFRKPKSTVACGGLR